MTHLPSSAAIVGLGITEVGKVYGTSAGEFAADAIRRAVADAGLGLHDVDGLLISQGLVPNELDLQRYLGLEDLQVHTYVHQAGSTACAQVQYAALAIASGMADTIVCVHSDAPLQPKSSGGAIYANSSTRPAGMASVAAAGGFFGPNPYYALAARRHMHAYGTTSEQLGAIAVAQRAWARGNPNAQMRDPITIDDHQASRMICDPLRLLDCCLVSNGGVAVVVTRADRARDLAQPPVYLWGWGQGHPGYAMERGTPFGLASGAAGSGARAMEMAGITPSDVSMCQLYDCYTFTVLLTLEDYGFCPKGDGGAFVASGALGPGGALPTNTGGGQLSSFYLWGMTPLSEAVIQARGQGGERQAPRHDVIVVSGNGGVLDFHSTLVVSPTEHS